MKESPRLAYVWLEAGLVLGAPPLSVGCRSITVGSKADPQNGCGSPVTGSCALVVLILLPSPGCLIHCVTPDCAANMARALGVEGPMMVSKKLSKSVKRSA